MNAYSFHAILKSKTPKLSHRKLETTWVRDRVYSRSFSRTVFDVYTEGRNSWGTMFHRGKISSETMASWIVSPTPSTSVECDALWKYGPYRCHQVNMRSLRQILIQCYWSLYKKEKFRHRDAQREDIKMHRKNMVSGQEECVHKPRDDKNCWSTPEVRRSKEGFSPKATDNPESPWF